MLVVQVHHGQPTLLLSNHLILVLLNLEVAVSDILARLALAQLQEREDNRLENIEPEITVEIEHACLAPLPQWYPQRLLTVELVPDALGWFAQRTWFIRAERWSYFARSNVKAETNLFAVYQPQKEHRIETVVPEPVALRIPDIRIWREKWGKIQIRQYIADVRAAMRKNFEQCQ